MRWWYLTTEHSPPTDWRRHFFNWTGAGVLGTYVQKIFRYHWNQTGATTANAALSAPPVEPLLKLDWSIRNFPMRKFCLWKFPIEETVTTSKTGLAHREFSYMEILLIGKPPIGRSGATSKIELEHKEFIYMEILHRKIPYRGKWRHF